MTSPCTASPCWALPLLDNAPPMPPAAAAKAEHRLLVLRKKMESGDHKHPLPAPSGRRFCQAASAPSSLPFATNEVGSFVTPKVIESAAPLSTPPTPGRKRPAALAFHKRPDAFPSFLPLGIRARVGREEVRRSSASQHRAGDALSSPKRLRISPRYESPWLAGFTVASPPLSSPSMSSDAAEQKQKKDANLDLLDKLQRASQMQLQGDETLPRRNSCRGSLSPRDLRDRLVQSARGGGSSGLGSPCCVPAQLQCDLKVGKSSPPLVPIPGQLPERRARIFEAMSA